MKKFLLGVVVGIILIFAWGMVTASVQQHRAVKAEQAARAAAEAARAAAAQAPVR
jgi:hypothetical protein